MSGYSPLLTAYCASLFLGRSPGDARIHLLPPECPWVPPVLPGEQSWSVVSHTLCAGLAVAQNPVGCMLPFEETF